MEQKPVNSKKRKLVGFVILAIFLLVLGRNLSFLPKIHLPFSTNEELTLKRDVDKIVLGKPGFYSVYFKDLKSGKSFGINEHQIETGASVNKLPIVAVLYSMAGKGEINLDDKITISKKDIQDYGTGSIRYQKPPVSYSLRNLAKLSLQESDNTAAHVLGVRLGTEKVQNLVDSWNLSQTSMANNKTTTYDMELLFEKIYKNEVANPPLTKELLSFLADSDFEDRLPLNLPKTVKVFHKTGDGQGFVHDVGLIEAGESVYYLGVMTSDIGDNEKLTKDTIAEISKKIFDGLDL